MTATAPEWVTWLTIVFSVLSIIFSLVVAWIVHR